MGTNLKQLAAARAVEAIRNGMVLGLGTGSTARYATEMIGERLRKGELRDIVGIPTSRETEELAKHVGIPLTTLQEHPVIDLTIDGADEVDPHLNLVKGQGGALLHEKIVARASRQEIIIVDDSKLVKTLGTRSPVAVEVIPFGWGTYAERLRRLGCEPVLRMHGSTPFLTDEGNYILDCRFAAIGDPEKTEHELNLITGVVENGIFVGLASSVLVASATGVSEMKAQ